MLVIEFDDEKVVRCNDSSIWVAGNEQEDAERGAEIINNHDRMAEEIAELKSHLENLVTESIALAQFKNDTLRGNIRSTDLDEPEWHDYQTIGEAGAYLAKLNQEGEE